MSIHNLQGHTLGQYELRELLGIGGMGAVYRGYQINLQRAVAVKVLSPMLAEDSSYIERFNREARIAASLEHAHIVRVYDYGTQENISYLVMHLLTGGALSQRMAQRADTENKMPSLGEVADLLKQLASGLDYAHEQGVIHRDIKPSNVMFDNQGNAYLVDFGIAKLLAVTSSLTAQGMVVGTWAYMPPEQWSSDELTPAADQYALGVVTYALVTGRLPFQAETPPVMMHKHLNEMPTPPHVQRPGVPEATSLVLGRALAKDPTERFPTVTAFAQAFEKAISGQAGENTNFWTASFHRKPAPQVNLTPSGGGSQGAALVRPITATQPIYRHPITWGLVTIVTVLALALIFVLVGQGKNNGSKTPAGSIGEVVASSTVTPSPTATPIIRTLPPPATATNPVDELDLAVTLAAQSATETVQAVFDRRLTQTAAVVPLSATPTSVITAIYARPTDTSTPLPSDTPTLTPSLTPSDTPTVTASPTLTETPSPTASPTLTVTLTPSPTPSDTPTFTLTPSETPTATSTATATLTATLTETPTATASFTPTVTPSLTASPTPTYTLTASATPSPTPSDTPTPTPTIVPSVLVGTPSPVIPTATLTPCQVADVNGNGAVDIFDLRLVAGLYGIRSDDPTYNARYDLDSSGEIDVLDLRRVAGQYGQMCP